MQIQFTHKPSYALASVQLAGGEEIRVEPGAMVSHSAGVEVETKAEGGLFGGLKRMVAGESFFQNTYKAPSQGGEITLAPALPGDMQIMQIEPGRDFMLQSGAYIASEMNVSVDAKWGGGKGFFGSGSLILLKVSGQGQVIVSCYGAIEERQIGAGETYIVDTGHIVGFDGDMAFNVKRVGNWKSTMLSGEGLVCELSGPGRVWMQTRSEEALINWILPKIPQKSN